MNNADTNRGEIDSRLAENPTPDQHPETGSSTNIPRPLSALADYDSEHRDELSDAGNPVPACDILHYLSNGTSGERGDPQHHDEQFQFVGLATSLLELIPYVIQDPQRSDASRTAFNTTDPTIRGMYEEMDDMPYLMSASPEETQQWEQIRTRNYPIPAFPVSNDMISAVRRQSVSVRMFRALFGLDVQPSRVGDITISELREEFLQFSRIGDYTRLLQEWTLKRLPFLNDGISDRR
ncbi:hypothetical protein N7541_011881 [Penicillium brevicompactum]|uniref:Uncharacterized protein n=1 Tax=Penicillium brevicompactum TaxID=5074 RepID=A0A9W9UIZ3_PENBR|nr:hypothetical protein N7541_011881 [Penicillium brevicompactum]